MFMSNDVISTVSPAYSFNSYPSHPPFLNFFFSEKRKTEFLLCKNKYFKTRHIEYIYYPIRLKILKDTSQGCAHFLNFYKILLSARFCGECAL